MFFQSEEKRLQELFNQCAQGFMEANDPTLQTAIRLGRKLFDKGNMDAGYLLGKLYAFSEDYKAAIDVYKSLERNHYNKTSVLFFLGKFYALEEQYQESFRYYVYYLEKEPFDAEGTFEIAKCYQMGRGTNRDLNLALMYFEKVEKSDWAKSNDIFENQYAECLEATGDYEKATLKYTAAFYDCRDDMFSKASYAYDLIEIHLKHDPYDAGLVGGIPKYAAEYYEQLEKIYKEAERSDDMFLDHIREAYYLAQNEINYYKATHRV